MKRAALIILLWSAISPAPPGNEPAPATPGGKAANVQNSGADNSANLFTPYLMDQMSKTDDPATKNMLMMMMMQAQMQQQQNKQAAKKNNETENKLKEVAVPTPQPLGKNPFEDQQKIQPDENLKLVEDAAKKKAELDKQIAAEKAKATPDPLPTFTLPTVDLKLTAQPGAVPAAATPSPSAAPVAMGPTSVPNVIDRKAETFNKPEVSAPGNGSLPGNDRVAPISNAKNGGSSPAQEVIGAERVLASTAPIEPARGMIRKTNEAEASAGGGGESGGGESGKSGGDDFFASLMEKMNGPGEGPDGGNISEDPSADPEDMVTLNIFQYANVRYRQAAYQENRVRVRRVPAAAH